MRQGQLVNVCNMCGGSGNVVRPRHYGAKLMPCPMCSGLSDVSENTMPRTRRDIETSRHAALDAVPRSGSWQMRALDAFIEAGPPGLTDYELAVALNRANMRGSVAKYRGALRDGGWVEESGRMRRTDTGSLAKVWTLTKRARSHVL